MYNIFFDGACDPNPGPCAFGVSIQKDGKEIDALAQYIGEGTNNVAEYHGLIGAIQLSESHNIDVATIYGDSLLVVNQVNGFWKVKNDRLQILQKIVIELLKKSKTKYTIVHIKRHLNERADQISKEGLQNHRMITI